MTPYTLRHRLRRFQLYTRLTCGLILMSTALAWASAWAQAPVPVIVTTVKSAPYPVTLQLLGTLKAKQSVTLSATVTETIQQIHFSDGARVEKGQRLVTLRNQEEKARLLEAQARLEEAKRQYQRAKEVVDRGNVTQALVDERYRQWQTAQAQQQIAQAQLSERYLHAPFAGQLGLKKVSEGA